MVQKLVLFLVIVSTVGSIQVQAALFGLFGKPKIDKDAFGDYVVPNSKFTYNYMMCDKHPKRMALYNEQTKTGLVIDGASERVAFETLNGDKLVMDMRNEKFSEGKSNPDLNEGDFQNILTEYDLSEETVEISFNQTERTEPPKVVESFCDYFKDLIRQVGGMIWKAIRFILSPFMEVLKLFGNLLILGAEMVWKVFKSGILALLNIFKWLGRLLGKIIGGIAKIVDAGVKLVLNAILTAANGALALWEILKSFIEHFDLMAILRFILKIPKMICHFISGLGGKIVQGITGIFEIIGAIFSFKISELFDLVSSFVKMILDFFRLGRPSRQNMIDATDKLLNVSEQQKQKYRNADDYKNYDQFLMATRGSNDFKIHGIPVGKVVNIVMETGASAKGAVMQILQAINPFASIKSTIPILMVTMIKSLNTTDGVGYVKQLFPDIKIPDDALTGTTRSLASELIIPKNVGESNLLNLPPPEMLRSMPIVKDIYKEFDDAAMEHTNSTLESLLEKEHVMRLVEFTTSVIGLGH